MHSPFSFSHLGGERDETTIRLREDGAAEWSAAALARVGIENQPLRSSRPIVGPLEWEAVYSVLSQCAEQKECAGG